jgi:hypothetical protein
MSLARTYLLWYQATMSRILLVLVVLAAACGKATPNGAPASSAVPTVCPPAEILLDGKPFAVGHGLAVHGLKFDNYVVSLFDTDTITCEDMLQLVSAKRSKVAEVRASAGGYTGVLFAGDIDTNVDAVLEKTPAAIGDPVVVCVPETVELPLQALDEYRGKKLTVRGRFEGSYCGETKQ